MCFTHVKYRGSGCKPRGLEDSTIRSDVNKPLPAARTSPISLTLAGAEKETTPEIFYRHKDIRDKRPRLCLFFWTEGQKIHKIYIYIYIYKPINYTQKKHVLMSLCLKLICVYKS